MAGPGGLLAAECPDLARSSRPTSGHLAEPSQDRLGHDLEPSPAHGPGGGALHLGGAAQGRRAHAEGRHPAQAGGDASWPIMWTAHRCRQPQFGCERPASASLPLVLLSEARERASFASCGRGRRGILPSDGRWGTSTAPNARSARAPCRARGATSSSSAQPSWRRARMACRRTPRASSRYRSRPPR